MAEVNGSGPPAPLPGWLPARVGRFGGAAELMRGTGRAAGFAEVRDQLLENYEVLKDDMPAAAIIKLAIDADRHALFVEMAADKSRGQDDQAAYGWFQRYLQGETDEVPVADGTVLIGRSVAQPARQVDPDEDEEEAPDGEGGEDD